MAEFKNVEDDFESLSKQELIKRLKNLETERRKDKEHVKSKEKRKFDWSNSSKRHVLLKFMYFGWDYHGYASQDCTEDTVEGYLFSALKQCCLIEERENSNYHRCGRTDKGVSAFAQTISLDLRSKHMFPDETNIKDELPYCKMLNRLLPLNIRCYTWSHVGSTVSARFDCTERSYSYFFPKGGLNIPAMSDAVKLLHGTHDFRNLCKMDVNNGVTEFIRTINKAEILPVPWEDSKSNDSGYNMMKLSITSRGFLWHQIRCIMGVLLLVGENNEEPDIISKLLDVESYPCKPQYYMANPLPLSLACVEYSDQQLTWYIDQEELDVLTSQLEGLWTEFAVKSCMVRDALQLLSPLSKDTKHWTRHLKLYSGVVNKVHKPLLKRPTCLSLEDRVENFEKRKNKCLDSSEETIKKRKVDHK